MRDVALDVRKSASISSEISNNGRKPVASTQWTPEPLLDTDQAAAIMRVHPKTLQRYARQGLVHGFQLGTMWRFRASEIDRWISERIAS